MVATLSNAPDDIVRDKLSNIISNSTKCPKLHGSVGNEFFKCMQQNGHKVAQYIAETGQEDTYEDLLKRSIRVALYIKSRNLTEDDVICLSSNNHINSCVPFIASLFLGIKVASLDPSFTTLEATHLIKLIKPKILFVVPEVLDVITTSSKDADVNTEIVVYGDDVDEEKFTPFENFLKPHENEDLFSPTEIKDVSDTAVIFFSSGTTGLPKGICVTHKGLYHSGFVVQNLGLSGPNGVLLSMTTLYWVSAVFNLTAAILDGAARLIVRKFEPEKMWIYLDKYKVSYIFFAPVLVNSLMAVGRPKGVDTSHLSVLVSAGAHLAEENLRKIRELLPGTSIFQAYGLTELSGFATGFNVTKTKDKLLLDHKLASCGRPVPGYRFRVVDPDTEENCEPNQRGELRIKSEYNTSGYYLQDSLSAFDSDGWVRTGDIFYYDEDLCFHIVDRIKEMLKYKSWHVPPAALEQVLQTHLAVRECVVIGIPHDLDGDHPMAIIKLYENYEKTVTPEEIEKFVEERVNDTHRLRGGVKFVKTIPTTPSGKPKRNELRSMALNGSL